jgi:hypothetical protein
LYIEELYNLLSSPNPLSRIQARKMRSAVHVPFKSEMRNAYRILVRKPEGKGQSDVPVRQRIILKWI